MSRTEALTELHAALDARWRPEDVAVSAVRNFAGVLPEDVLRHLRQMSAFAERAYVPAGYSSMDKDFERPVFASDQMIAAFNLADTFGVELDSTPPASDTEAVAVWCADALARVAAADVSTGRAAKLRRSIGRVSAKNTRAAQMAASRKLVQIGRSGFAARIDAGEFAKDAMTAVAVAYTAARRNLRREFTLAGKAGTTDHVVETFDRLLAASDTTNWWAWAHVRPTPTVLARLTDEQRTSLLVDWSEAMQDAARRLADLDAAGTRAHGRVKVRRGDNSTEWNIAARAYNTARDNWFACLDACGLSVARVACCPPKALRLMAADLMYAHSVTGGDNHPDSRVAAHLPAPWEVVLDGAECTEAQVVAACDIESVPVKGWVNLRSKRGTEQLAATPELVHGVAVADPLLAGALRRAGAWSGPSKASSVDHAALDELASRLPNMFERGL